MPKLVKTTSSYLIFLDDDGEVDFGPSSVFADDEEAQHEEKKPRPKAPRKSGWWQLGLGLGE